MSLVKIAYKSVCFYWRTSVAVIAAVLVSTAVLVGALVVGDSVRYSLAKMVDERLGLSNSALIAQDRFFTAGLAGKISGETATVIQLSGTAANDDGTKRVNNVSVLGVDGKFWGLGQAKTGFDIKADEAVVNAKLAERLGVKAGDEILVRVAKPSLMPRDIVLTPDSDASLAIRVTVKGVAGRDGMGNFGLGAEQVASENVFLSRDWLGEKIEQAGRANLLLTEKNAEDTKGLLADGLTMDDIGLKVQFDDERGLIEVKSRRVFIEDSVCETLLAVDNGKGVLTYFVNELRRGDKATPYSMVAGMDGEQGQADDEIVITDWLAEDIGADVGDEIELKYFTAEAGSELIEDSSKFRVSKVIPMKSDKSLMPNFPGLSDSENCMDWDPGIPIDLDKIRDKDEKYWDEYGGTPKAYVTLAAGQKMWANRFGKLTAVRYSANDITRDEIDEAVLLNTKPASLGLYFQNVRQRGENAGKQGTDFGGLFIGLSMFLIMAAVILMSLVFVFGVERRLAEAGIMLAVGLTNRQVKMVFLLEGGLLALIGSALGSLAGLGYTRVMIYALSTVWAGAVADSAIRFYAAPVTVAVGALSGFVISMFVIYFDLRKHLKRQARELLAGLAEVVSNLRSVVKNYIMLIAAGVFFVGAIVMIALAGGDEGAAEVFFSAGGMLLLSGLLLAAVVVKWIGTGQGKKVLSIKSVAFRNSTRRAGRSLSVIVMLAIGSFLVISVGANRKDLSVESTNRKSGTGGFALIAESSIPITNDIEYAGASVVNLRVKEGDDASCLNLNRAQVPVLLGVDAEELSSRGAFGFTKSSLNVDDGWDVLDVDAGGEYVAAIGDEATVTWGLGKKVGDEIEYTDEQGNPFKIKIVSVIQNSILQGKLVISEVNFIEMFPSAEGYKLFLIDAEHDAIGGVSDGLSRQLRDYGFDVQSTTDKLADFAEVENTYLSIFQILSGLAMVIGSIGLGLVVMINVLDRRGELAMMRAVGFTRDKLKGMILAEHGGVLAGGLIIGVISAIIAVWPSLISPGAEVPYVSLLMTVIVIFASGFIWIWLAAAAALSGELMEALRNE